MNQPIYHKDKFLQRNAAMGSVFFLFFILSLPVNPVRAQSTAWTADPVLVEKLSDRPNHPFNYREQEVPAYQLPPIVDQDPADYSIEAWGTRRAELLDLFRSNVYGYRPSELQLGDQKITYRVVSAVVDPTGGLASGEQVECVIDRNGKEFRFPFYFFAPKDASGPTPLIILINNREFPDPEKMVDQLNEFWPLDLIIKSGFSTACFFTSDVDPDRADGYELGVRGFLADNQPRSEDSWGSLSAWGWAASRVLDHAIASHPINPQRIAIVGHSRGGKTALWAAAEDPRFTIAYSNESGCGGAALSRRRYGETVGRITTAFPHWFNENFASYADRENELPIDQHQLIALLAPRKVYIASAADDLWADPKGEYLSLVAAAPAFQIFGKESITELEPPPLNSQRVSGPTGYHIRDGEHNLTRRDWQFFLDFAAKP